MFWFREIIQVMCCFQLLKKKLWLQNCQSQIFVILVLWVSAEVPTFRRIYADRSHLLYQFISYFLGMNMHKSQLFYYFSVHQRNRLHWPTDYNNHSSWGPQKNGHLPTFWGAHLGVQFTWTSHGYITIDYSNVGKTNAICTIPQSSPFFIGGMFTIPSHGWFMTLFHPHYTILLTKFNHC